MSGTTQQCLLPAAADHELQLNQPRTDLGTLRAADPLLDAESSRIQRAAAVGATALQRRHDADRAAWLNGRRILVTGSAGYVGTALVEALRGLGAEVLGLDVLQGKTVDLVADVADANAVRAAVAGCDGVLHTAARHAPHASHFHESEFIKTNVDGTQNILNAAAEARACVVYTSTTSLTITKRVKSSEAAGSLVWLDESAQSPTAMTDAGDPADAPRNKYGRTKLEAERRCMRAASCGQAVVVLRISRCFPEDALPAAEASAHPSLSTPNAKANELLGRRVALVDVVDGHLRALTRCAGREPSVVGKVLTLSAPWPWSRAETPTAAADLPEFLRRERPELAGLYSDLGWSLSPVRRVYDSARAVDVLQWHAAVTFDTAMAVLRAKSGGARSLAAGEIDAEDVRAGRY